MFKHRLYSSSMASSQPIALPAHTAHDYIMGSYSDDPSRTFNPASYTRHFLGSPISWRAGDFSARFPQGSPTAQLLSSIDPNDPKYNNKMSTSLDSDRGSLINAFNVFDREGELCRNYTCCGIHLQDLHALLEHFEEVHILVVDPKAPAQIQVPFNPQCVSSQHPQSTQLPHQPQQQQQPQRTFDSSDDMEFDIDLDSSSAHSVPPTPAATSSRSSPSSAAPTPPRTPISAPLSAYPSPTVAAPPSLAYLQPQSHYIQSAQFTQYQGTPYASAHTSPYTSQPPSPGINSQPHPHLSAFPHPLQNHTQHPNVVAHPEEAFNSYARFSSDYSSQFPGAQYNGANGDDQVVVPPEYTGAPTVVGEYAPNQQQGYLGQGMGIQQGQIGDAQGQQGQQQCIPPALLFGTVNATGGERKSRDGVSGSKPRVSSPQPLPSKVRLKIRGLGDHATRSTPTTPTTISPSHTPGPPSATATTNSVSNAPPTSTNQVQVATSSLLLSKPFRCPKPNCNKSYKQANGLKYHMTHGSCNFAPPKDLEHVKDLLERKRREREAREGENGGVGSSGVSGRGGLSRSASVGSIGTKGASSPRLTDSSGALATSTSTNVNPNPNGTDAYYTDLAGLGSITETELREVEREAEKRLRPFACGVGDCQRRYKNMNGLRYHYQHSGDHGAVGLALLAGGLHECLSGNNHHRNDSHNTTSSTSTSTSTSTDTDTKNKPKHQHQYNPTLAHNLGLNYHNNSQGHGVGEEREGRKRALYRTAAVAGGGSGRGSVSVPVSRAGSVVGGTRVGTPVVALGLVAAKAGQNPNPNGASSALGASGNVSPPLTPLTAAVQGLGLGVNATGTGTRSQPHSPTGNGFMQQQQQQLQYQKQFMELQRRRYFQQQQDAYQHQQQQQQQETYVQQQQQQEFHPEFQPTQQNEFHPPQLQEYHLVQSSPTQAQGQVQQALSQPQSPTQPSDFRSHPQGEYRVTSGDFSHPQQQQSQQQQQQRGNTFHPHAQPQHQHQQHMPMNLGMNESFDAQAQREFVEEQRVQAERAQKQRELERGFQHQQQQQQRFGVGDVAMV